MRQRRIRGAPGADRLVGGGDGDDSDDDADEAAVYSEHVLSGVRPRHGGTADARLAMFRRSRLERATVRRAGGRRRRDAPPSPSRSCSGHRTTTGTCAGRRRGCCWRRVAGSTGGGSSAAAATSAEAFVLAALGSDRRVAESPRRVPGSQPRRRLLAVRQPGGASRSDARRFERKLTGVLAAASRRRPSRRLMSLRPGCPRVRRAIGPSMPRTPSTPARARAHELRGGGDGAGSRGRPPSRSASACAAFRSTRRASRSTRTTS